MNRKKFLIVAILLIFHFCLNAQVAINNNGSSPDSSAALDIQSSSGGILIPRLDDTEMNNISDPAIGLMIFNSSHNNFYFYDGSSWKQVYGYPDSDWNVSGDDMFSGVDGYVGIGTSSPESDLHVYSDSNNQGLTLQLADNTYNQGIRFKNAGQRYAWHLYRRDNGSSRADLVFASGYSSDLSALNDRIFFNWNGELGVGSQPASSAMLEVASTTKGFLPPRMTEAQRDAIINPEPGLQIFNITSHKPNYYNGQLWMQFDGRAAEPLSIGDFYQGGVVFYLDGNGGGLICSVEEVSSLITWSNGSNVLTGAQDTLIGTGQANTTTIINIQGSGSYAASICDNYTYDVYSDWYLPSKDELNEMRKNGSAINTISLANGGDGFGGTYWSSSEMSTTGAWAQNMASGGGTSYWKLSIQRVRAVRNF